MIMESEKKTILSVNDLSISFNMYGKGFERRRLKAIGNLSVDVLEGEILAVVGPSGSGKSLLAHAILGILPRNAVVGGDISYKGEPLTAACAKKLRGSEIAFVPQSVEYLDPLMKVGRQVSRDKSSVEKAFIRYKLDISVGKLFPHQLSGGMMRRVLCATAVVSGAKLLIADEPTPGMSKELARRAMKHFRDLAVEGAAVMLITHDIDLALGYCDRVVVLYAGAAVETAPVSDFADESLLRHPYTKALWRAMPQNGFRPMEGTWTCEGSTPEGCTFASCCDMRTGECVSGAIKPRAIRGGEVCCLYAT